jgi:hypothetical protein
MVKLSWKEKYAGILVLFISIIFLLMQIMASFGESAKSYSIQNGSFVINKNEFFSDLRTYSVILAGIIAGWCLLKGKRLGYMLGLPILLFTLSLAGFMVAEQLMKVKKFNNSMIGFGVAIFLLLLAVIFLLLPVARQRYRVNKMIFLLTLLLFAGLGGAYIYLQ